MRSVLYVWVFVSFLFSMTLSGSFAGTSWAQCTDPIRSPTYGKPASKFVSGCEIYLFGEYLEPVEGPDGEMGYLVEKTDSAVTINGRHFSSPYDPPKKPVKTPSERDKHITAVIEGTVEEIRRLAVAHPSLEKAYFIDSVLYTDEPKPYVTASGDTVMLQFRKESARIIYEDAPLVFELNPYRGPFLSEEERNELYIDNAYQGLASIRSGFIILIGRGYKNWYPLTVVPDLKAALIRIPALAQRRYRNIYGE